MKKREFMQGLKYIGACTDAIKHLDIFPEEGFDLEIVLDYLLTGNKYYLIQLIHKMYDYEVYLSFLPLDYVVSFVDARGKYAFLQEVDSYLRTGKSINYASE